MSERQSLVASITVPLTIWFASPSSYSTLADSSLHNYLVTNILILPIYFRNSCHHHHFRIYPPDDWRREHRYLNTRTGQCSLAQPFCSFTCWRSNDLSYRRTWPAQLWHLAEKVKTSLWVPTGHPLTSNRTLEAEEDLAKGHCRDSISMLGSLPS